MILTNKYGLPQFLCDKIKSDLFADPYGIADRKDEAFRVTQIIAPPLPKTLYEQFKDSDELVIDASFYLATQFGTSYHAMMSGVDTDMQYFNVHFKREIEHGSKKLVICGTLDELEFFTDSNRIVIRDNKTSKIVNMDYPIDDGYIKQLNMYEWELAGNFDAYNDANEIGLDVRYFIKDFSFIEMARSAVYPRCQIITKPVERMGLEATEKYIHQRLEEHITNPTRLCTPDERFDKSKTTYAVMKQGNKTAVRGGTGFASYEQAQGFIGSAKPEERARLYVETREPAACERDKKCRFYCDVVSVCPYAKSMGYKPL